jgi:hypothetical protein
MARESQSSVWAWLVEATRSSIGWTAAPQTPPAGDPAALRAAMRGLLQEAGMGSRAAVRVAVAIDRCTDLRSLWYLRPSLMQALAAERGEREARRAVAGLDPLFLAAWPQVPLSRHLLLD